MESGLFMSYATKRYGMMNAALLAYKKLAKLLRDWSFVMNVYNPCVWNKQVECAQCTIMYHIDDILASHLFEASCHNHVHQMI